MTEAKTSPVETTGEIVPQETPAESVSIIQLIARAASDPRVNIDKMEWLLEMQERILDRQASILFSEDFAAMQTKLPEIPKHGKGHGTITYALWEDVNDLIKPVLSEHGFGLSFKVSDAEAGITVTAVLRHRGGHLEETSYTFQADATGSKNAIQAIGSSMSYGKRYTAAALLNLTTRDGLEDDDDGDKAIKRPSSAHMKRCLKELDDEFLDVRSTAAMMKCWHFWQDRMDKEHWPEESVDDGNYRHIVREKFSEHRGRLEAVEIKGDQQADEANARDPADLHPLEAG